MKNLNILSLAFLLTGAATSIQAMEGGEDQPPKKPGWGYRPEERKGFLEGVESTGQLTPGQLAILGMLMGKKEQETLQETEAAQVELAIQQSLEDMKRKEAEKKAAQESKEEEKQ